MKVGILVSTTDRILTVLHELFMKPTLPLWNESFYRDISTPLRHDHDILEGHPRTLELFQLFQPLSLLVVTCLCLTVYVVISTKGHVCLCPECWTKQKQTNKKNATFQLFSFYEAWTIKKHVHTSCVNVTLHLISISVGELQRPPCMQPSHIHNSRSHPPSIWMSLSCTIHCTNPPSFKPHPLSWPFPCSHTHKPEPCTVSLKLDHTTLSLWRCDQSSLH